MSFSNPSHHISSPYPISQAETYWNAQSNQWKRETLDSYLRFRPDYTYTEVLEDVWFRMRELIDTEKEFEDIPF